MKIPTRKLNLNTNPIRTRRIRRTPRRINLTWITEITKIRRTRRVESSTTRTTAECRRTADVAVEVVVVVAEAAPTVMTTIVSDSERRTPLSMPLLAMTSSQLVESAVCVACAAWLTVAWHLLLSVAVESVDDPCVDVEWATTTTVVPSNTTLYLAPTTMMTSTCNLAPVVAITVAFPTISTRTLVATHPREACAECVVVAA